MDPFWEPIISSYPKYTFLTAPSPRPDPDNYIKCIRLCEENKCGNYGKSWGCPPGAPGLEEISAILGSYPDTLVMTRRYDVPDMNDKDLMDAISLDFQKALRTVATKAKASGKEVFPLGEGGCRYCARCSYPDPCSSPDKRIVSVSGTGIDLEGYLKGLGIEFGFEKTAVTFYGLILYK